MELPNLKLGESFEISHDEFANYKQFFMIKAYKLATMYRTFGYKAISENYFFHESNIPCLYSDWASERRNPKTGRILKQRVLPDGYRQVSNSRIYHFSPVGCPGLIPFYSVVWCLSCNSMYENFISYHRVGECPFKMDISPALFYNS
jgi:hypothetical protein